MMMMMMNLKKAAKKQVLAGPLDLSWGVVQVRWRERLQGLNLQGGYLHQSR